MHALRGRLSAGHSFPFDINIHPSLVDEDLLVRNVRTGISQPVVTGEFEISCPYEEGQLCLIVWYPSHNDSERRQRRRKQRQWQQETRRRRPSMAATDHTGLSLFFLILPFADRMSPQVTLHTAPGAGPRFAQQLPFTLE